MMKTKIAYLLTFLAGLLVIISEFIPHKPFGSMIDELENWFMIIAGFSIILGQINLFKVHFIKIRRKMENWPYYVVTLVSFVAMITAGMLWGTQTQKGILGNGERISAFCGMKPFDWLFEFVYQHLSATIFALLAFYIASAAYRAFIARTVEANLLLISAIIVMLGSTSLGVMLTGWLPAKLSFLSLPNIAAYIMDYPTTAGQRAIMISAGLGMIGSALRIILGIERSYLGGE